MHKFYSTLYLPSFYSSLTPNTTDMKRKRVEMDEFFLISDNETEIHLSIIFCQYMETMKIYKKWMSEIYIQVLQLRFID